MKQRLIPLLGRLRAQAEGATVRFEPTWPAQVKRALHIPLLGNLCAQVEDVIAPAEAAWPAHQYRRAVTP
jgi:hypothetical protein